jgi:hypothetical protein
MARLCLGLNSRLGDGNDSPSRRWQADGRVKQRWSYRANIAQWSSGTNRDGAARVLRQLDP